MKTYPVIADAEAWLLEALDDGPKPYAWIVRESPYSPTTLRRAAAELGVESHTRRSWPRSTQWALPK